MCRAAECRPNRKVPVRIKRDASSAFFAHCYFHMLHNRSKTTCVAVGAWSMLLTRDIGVGLPGLKLEKSSSSSSREERFWISRSATSARGGLNVTVTVSRLAERGYGYDLIITGRVSVTQSLVTRRSSVVSGSAAAWGRAAAAGGQSFSTGGKL